MFKVYALLTVRSRYDSNGICNLSCTQACAVKAPISQNACRCLLPFTGP